MAWVDGFRIVSLSMNLPAEDKMRYKKKSLRKKLRPAIFDIMC